MVMWWQKACNVLLTDFSFLLGFFGFFWLVGFCFVSFGFVWVFGWLVGFFLVPGSFCLFVFHTEVPSREVKMQ